MIEEHLGIIYAIMQTLDIKEIKLAKELFYITSKSPSMIITYDSENKEYTIKLKENTNEKD